MFEDLRGYLRRPLAIGNRSIESRLVLAPMTFLGHVALRELIEGFGGCALAFSEMCSAKAVCRENRFASAYFRWRDAERNRLSIQIFGNDARTLALAARRIESEGLFGVDINFGCADAAICKRNCGAALLKDPRRAAAIVAAVRRAVGFPLTVKFRTGWQDDPQAAVRLAKGFESAGADALVFHPRVAPDRRLRPPRWEYIGLVKQAVSIPVFGNGDVFDQPGCLEMIRKTGCDGVAIGRLAVARPWIFAEWIHDLRAEADIFLHTCLELMKLLQKHYEAQAAIRRFRRFAYFFAANFQFGHTFYTQIRASGDFRTLEGAIRRFFSRNPRVLARPNMNYFI